MSREPSYPEEAAVGTPAEETGASPAPGRAPRGEDGKRKHLVTGAAIGIGSAALVAALLYANRSRRDDKRRD